MSASPYVLVCAGEDSGDVLGEAFVRSLCERGIRVVGSGGGRMQRAGLSSLVEFDKLAVSGFGDVFPRYFELRRQYNVLRKSLLSENCIGFVAIDYPGYNMKLCALAKKLQKPMLYVAPPQIWAWNTRRGKKLQSVNLAVLFDFEKQAYARFRCPSKILAHPFFAKLESEKTQNPVSVSDRLLLLPGSRKTQALRNLNMFLEVAKFWNGPVDIIAARNSLVESFKNRIAEKKFSGEISVIVSPQDAEQRYKLYASGAKAIASPGTVTLELAASGTPFVVSMVADTLTYCIGSAFVKTKLFALPNILLGQRKIPEFIYAPWNWKSNVATVSEKLRTLEKRDSVKLAADLRQRMVSEVSADELIQSLVSV